MTWSGLDIAIILLGVGQIAGISGVVWAALKIKNGPVTQIQRRVVPLIGAGKSLYVAGKDAWEANREQGVLLFDTAKEAVQTVRHAVTPPASIADAPITYRKIGTALAGIKTARQSVGFLRRLARGKKASQGQVNAVPFAERIGLVPPSGTPTRKVIGFARFLLRVRGLLKNGGVV